MCTDDRAEDPLCCALHLANLQQNILRQAKEIALGRELLESPQTKAEEPENLNFQLEHFIRILYTISKELAFSSTNRIFRDKSI